MPAFFFYLNFDLLHLVVYKWFKMTKFPNLQAIKYVCIGFEF